LSVPFRSFVPAAGRLPLVAPALLLAGGAALSAQDAGAFRVGLSASLAQPLTAEATDADGVRFKDCLSAGVSLGASAELGLARNVAIRARAEYLSFGGKDSLYSQTQTVNVPGYGAVVATATGRLDYGLKAVALGADFVYSFSSNNDGGYVFGGLGYYMTDGSGSMATEVSALGVVISGDPIALEGSGGALGYSLGAGWRLSRNFAAEARFAATSGLKHKVKADIEDSSLENIDIGLGWIQVGVCYRF
jgi:hypothetical protein